MTGPEQEHMLRGASMADPTLSLVPSTRREGICPAKASRGCWAWYLSEPKEVDAI